MIPMEILLKTLPRIPRLKASKHKRDGPGCTYWHPGPLCCCESSAGPYSGAKAVFESAAARSAVKKQKNIVDMLHLGKLTVYNNRKARSFSVKGVGGCEKNEAEGRNIGWDMEGIPDTGCCHVAADILCIMRPDGVAPCERRG